MEDKSKSFYDFLTSNANRQIPETKKVHFIYKALAWIVIFICNSLLLQVCWNFGIKQIIDFPSISFIQSIMVYIFAKILTRGLFTAQ